MSATQAIDEPQRTSAPSRRNDRIGFINAALDRAWTHGFATRPQLDAGALIDTARAVTGFADFGPDDSWEERLNRLVASLRSEAQLNALGTTIAFGQIMSALSNRLRSIALLTRHPEIKDVKLPAPLIIVGQMRSGSTRIQRLLACDRRLVFTRFFESWNPLPRWPWLPFDDRRLRASAALGVARSLNPRFNAIHPTSADAADEEIGLHTIAIYGSALEAQWKIPGFAHYGERTDARPIYAEMRRHLQIIKWLRGDASDRPWILKLPQFSQDLEALRATFPDARVIYLSRDPIAVVGSSASLVHNQMSLQSDTVDPVWIGHETLRKVRLRGDRMAAAKAGSWFPSVDLDYGATSCCWRTELRKVYDLLDMPLTLDVVARMSAYMARAGRSQAETHRYDLADFGLSTQQILDRKAASPDRGSTCGVAARALV